MTSILFVIDNLEFGGGERGFLQLIRAVAGEGWTVAVAAHPGGPFEAGVRAACAAFVPLDMASQLGLATVARLRRLVRTGGFALVHSQGARADFFARLALLGVPRVRLVSTVQMPAEGFEVGALRRAAYRAADRLGRGRVDRFIVVSEALRRRLVEGRGLWPWQVTLVPNGVELAPPPAQAATLRRELDLPGGARLVGAAGRLVWQKGFGNLVVAMPDVIARVPDARLIIAGEGPLWRELEARAGAAGVAERVRLVGFQSDMPRFLTTLDVLVVPSVREGFPMITLEAMALGVPIVATAIDGIAEQITPDREGLLVAPGEPAALARAIVAVLEDRALAARLGAAGRRRASAFDLRRTLAATRRVYAELLGAPGGLASKP